MQSCFSPDEYDTAKELEAHHEAEDAWNRSQICTFLSSLTPAFPLKSSADDIPCPKLLIFKRSICMHGGIFNCVIACTFEPKSNYAQPTVSTAICMWTDVSLHLRQIGMSRLNSHMHVD